MINWVSCRTMEANRQRSLTPLKTLLKRVRAQTRFSHNSSYLYEPFEANKKLFRQGIKITKLKSFAEDSKEVNGKSFLALTHDLDVLSKCVKCFEESNLMKIEVTLKSLHVLDSFIFNRSLIVHLTADGNLILWH